MEIRKVGEAMKIVGVIENVKIRARMLDLPK